MKKFLAIFISVIFVIYFAYKAFLAYVIYKGYSPSFHRIKKYFQ